MESFEGGVALSEGLPLMEIADQLGFASDTVFAQFFKKMTGQTPKQYCK